MSHKRKIRERKREKDAECKAAHFDTEALAKGMQVMIRDQGQQSTREWSNKCRSWHVYRYN